MNKVQDFHDQQLNETQKGHVSTAVNAASQLFNAVTGIITGGGNQSTGADGEKATEDGRQETQESEDQSQDIGEKSKQEHARNDSAIGTDDAQTKDESKSKDEDDKADTGKPEQKDVVGGFPEEEEDKSTEAKDDTTGGPSETEPEKDDSQVESKEPFFGAAEPADPQEQSEAHKPSGDRKDENEGTGTKEAKDAGMTETQPDLLEGSKDDRPSIDGVQKKAAENDPTSENKEEIEGQNASEKPAEMKDGNPEDEASKDQDEGDNNQDDGASGLKGAAAETSPQQDKKPDDKPEGGEQTSLPNEEETLPPEESEDKPEEKSERTQAALGEQSEDGEKPHQDDEGEKPFAQESGQDDDKPQSGGNETEEAGMHETEPNLLEASEKEQSSADDAREKAEENAPDVGGSSEPQTGEDEQPSKDEPKAVEQEQGAEDPKDAMEPDKPTDATEEKDAAGTMNTELDASEAEQPSVDHAQENTEEIAPQFEEPNTESAEGDKSESNKPAETDKPDSDTPASVDKPETDGQLSQGDAKTDEHEDSSEPKQISETGKPDDAGGASEPNEAKDAGTHETQPDLLTVSKTKQPSIDDARDKAKENTPALEGLGDQQSGGDKSEVAEPSDQFAPQDRQPQDESSAEAKEPGSTECQVNGMPGADASEEEEPPKTQDSALEAAESKDVPTSQPESDNIEKKPSMLDAGDSASQSSDNDTQRELPDRSKGEEARDTPKLSKVDTQIADGKATLDGGVPVENDAEEEYDEEGDDTKGSGKKVKFTDKLKRKIHEMKQH